MAGYDFLPRDVRVVEVARARSGRPAWAATSPTWAPMSSRSKASTVTPCATAARRRSGVLDGVGFLHLRWNRGKRSVGIDLKAPEGADLFRRLAASADVVVEGMRAGCSTASDSASTTCAPATRHWSSARSPASGATGPTIASAPMGRRSTPSQGCRRQPLRPHARGASGQRVHGDRHARHGAPRRPRRARRLGPRPRHRGGRADRGGGRRLGCPLAARRGRHGAQPPVAARAAGVPQQLRASGVLAAAVAVRHRRSARRVLPGVQPEVLASVLRCHRSRRSGRGVRGRRDHGRTDDEVHPALVPIFASRTLAEWMAVFLEHDVPGGPANTLDDLAIDPHFLARDNVYDVDVPVGRRSTSRRPRSRRPARRSRRRSRRPRAGHDGGVPRRSRALRLTARSSVSPPV